MSIDAGPIPLVDACLRRLERPATSTSWSSPRSRRPREWAARRAARRGRRGAAQPLDQPASVARGVAHLGGGRRGSVVIGRAGMRGAVGSAGWQVRWAVLWPLPASPGAVLEDSGDSIEGSIVNDASVVLAIEAGGLRLLDLGDLENTAQGGSSRRSALHAADRRGEGLHDGPHVEDPSLYARMRPRVALIGVDPTHIPAPDVSTLAMLAASVR